MGEDVDGVVGVADVICEEDCVLFSWRFKDLHEMLVVQPALELTLERFDFSLAY